MPVLTQATADMPAHIDPGYACADMAGRTWAGNRIAIDDRDTGTTHVALRGIKLVEFPPESNQLTLPVHPIPF